MKVLSLFSGVGGFDLGLERAGFETVFQCEWDKHCNTILHKHWPDVPKWGDVSTLTGKHILAHAPVIDVVAWGSPCQDLSVAGKRAGLEGGRSNLFHEGIRIIKELRKETNGQYPKISIWENVYGALNSNRGADFGVILDQMAEAGALVIEWAVLDAQYFGVPQRRRRVFVIAIFDPVFANQCPNPLLPVRKSLPGDIKKSKQKRQNTATEIAGCLRSGGDGGVPSSRGEHLVIEPFTATSFAGYSEGVGTLRANGGDLGGGSETLLTEPFVKVIRSGARLSDGTLPADVWRKEETAPTLNSFDQGEIRATTVIVEQLMLLDGRRNNDVRIYESPVQTLEARMGTGGNNVPMLAFEPIIFSHTQGLDAQPSEIASPTLRREGNGMAVTYAIQGNVIGRQDHNGPAGKGHTEEGDPMFTLTGTDIHAVSQEEPTMAVRRLTPLECERLMGWPDDHTRYKADGTEQADSHRYKQAGNGVASPVTEWIGKQILKVNNEIR